MIKLSKFIGVFFLITYAENEANHKIQKIKENVTLYETLPLVR